MGIPVKIKNALICYPHMWEKHTPPGTDKAKYGAEFILDPVTNAADIAALDAAFQQVAVEAGKGAMVQFLKNPCQDGNTMNQLAQTKGKNPRPELVGKRVLRASDPDNPPVVVDQNLLPITQDKSAALFGGCVVHAYVDLYWSANATNPGVYCGLRGVQLVNNVGVTRIGGTSLSAEEMFSPVAGAPAPLSPPPAAGDPSSWM